MSSSEISKCAFNDCLGQTRLILNKTQWIKFNRCATCTKLRFKRWPCSLTDSELMQSMIHLDKTRNIYGNVILSKMATSLL